MSHSGFSTQFWIAIATTAALAVTTGTAAGRPTLEQVFASTAFEADDLDGLRRGEVVTTAVHEVGRRELAVALACLVDAAPDDLLRAFRGDRPVLPARHLTDGGRLGSEADWAAVDRSTQLLDTARELVHYLQAAPGFDLNLSKEEIDRLGEISETKNSDVADRSEEVRGAIRRMLEVRYTAYRERGLDGIAEFVRGPDDVVVPGELLERSQDASKGLAAVFPSFYQQWLQYPTPMPPPAEQPIEDAFFWSRLDIEERPAWLLTHRFASEQVLGQRSFYVSHFLDAGMSFVAAVEVPEGTVLAYVSRVWIDDLTGFGSSIKKRLGRRLLSSTMSDIVERLDVCKRAAQ
jgi:hypothetical protein